MVEDASGTRFASHRQPRTGLTSSPAASSNPGCGKSGPWAYGRSFGKRRPKGPTPRHNALRPMPVTMPRHAASQPVRSEARPGVPSTAPQLQPRHLRPRHPAPFFLRPASPRCSPRPLTTTTRPFVYRSARCGLVQARVAPGDKLRCPLRSVHRDVWIDLGARTVGSGGVSAAFADGPQSGSHGHVSRGPLFHPGRPDFPSPVGGLSLSPRCLPTASRNSGAGTHTPLAGVVCSVARLVPSGDSVTRSVPGPVDGTLPKTRASLTIDYLHLAQGCIDYSPCPSVSEGQEHLSVGGGSLSLLTHWRT
jgi:hypothetical protein